jgi:hypothetical protein
MTDDLTPTPEAIQPEKVSVATVAAGHGGSGYAVNDLVYLPFGATLKVLTVSSGAITGSLTITNGGNCNATSIPANPVAQVSSSGAGTGAAFNLTWIPISSALPIDPAGNPTVPVVGNAAGIPGEPLIKTNAGHDYTLALPTFNGPPLIPVGTIFNASLVPPYSGTQPPANNAHPLPASIAFNRAPPFPAYPS